ncbi:MAG: prolipoprotein diacylglyceryl transferase [Chloroflexi bacterium]|nr:prolipoprotein diacylglyceryl transferase [Chloroflexota bacterium]
MKNKPVGAGRSLWARMRRVSWYWYVIGVWLAVLAGLYGYHLATAVTPNRVAFSFGGGFDVYWYGLCIVGGIALGAFVVADLALRRGTAVFQEHVPAAIRARSLADLALPEEIHQILSKNKLNTLGDLLLIWGFNPRNTTLNAAGIEIVQAKLDNQTDLEKSWLSETPWRIWNPDHVWNGLIWCLILAVIGARLYHVLTPSPSMAAFGINSPMDYFRNPYQLINLRNGGLGIYGGILGGLVGLAIYSRRARIPLLGWADLAVVGLALGQVFGRWGNFFNQELYGRPTNLPWAVTIDPIYRLPDYSQFTRFHPAFLYESLWSLLTFIILYTLIRRYNHKVLIGDVMALYFIFYATGRILLELVRLDSRMVNLGFVQLNMAIATFISLLIALGMAAWIIGRHYRAAKTKTPAAVS